MATPEHERSTAQGDFVDAMLDQLERETAVLYAVARRFCLVYERMSPATDGAPTIGHATGELKDACLQHDRAYQLWESACDGTPAELEPVDITPPNWG